MKKKSSSKAKQPFKLTQIQAHAEHQRRHRITMGIGIVIIAVLLALVLVLVIVPHVRDSMRLHRINQIYSSISTPSLVYDEQDDIFGDKRLAGEASIPSSKSFVVGQTVDDAFVSFDEAIRTAGYEKVSDFSTTSRQGTYKTDKGEYVYLNVESKTRLDAFQNQIWMKDTSGSFNTIDPNAGPARVTISVNLDDNNE